MGSGSAKIAEVVQSNLKNTRGKEREKKKNQKRVQIFANNTRNTAYKTRWNIIPLPRLPSLYWILRINKPRLRHEHADPNATRLQRVFQHKTENILDSFYRRVLKMRRH